MRFRRKLHPQILRKSGLTGAGQGAQGWMKRACEAILQLADMEYRLANASTSYAAKWLIVLIATLGFSCVHQQPRVPLDYVGNSAQTTDAANVFAEVIDPCVAVRTSNGRLDIRGTVNNRTLRARFSFAIMTGAGARFQSDQGANSSVLWMVGEEASAWLPKTGTVISRQPVRDLLEASVGLRLAARDLERLLVCPSGGEGSSAGAGIRLTDGWLRLFAEDPIGRLDIYERLNTHQEPQLSMVRRESNGDGWRADFGRYRNGMWEVVHLRS